MINLCAGPTLIAPEVKEAMNTYLTNPDMDPNYTKFHRNMEKKISKLIHTDATSFIMLGEGIMGLDASIASLMDRGERVLVLSNGVFGEGFADYIERYQGVPVLFKGHPRRGIDVEELQHFLEKDPNFSLATMVHCETPSGITNNIYAICNLLKKYGILSIVDSVSGMGGEELYFDDFGIDVLLGGSQKSISAPTGLTLITLSSLAKEKIAQRVHPVPGYYLNFENYYSYQDHFDFPYTMSENLTYALDKALDLLLAKDYVEEHRKAAEVIRHTVVESGLELFALDHPSNTVTTVYAPEFLSKEEIIQKLYHKGILISGGFGEELKNTFRIAHMGNSIQDQYFELLFSSLDELFREAGHEIKLSENYHRIKKEYNLF